MGTAAVSAALLLLMAFSTITGGRAGIVSNICNTVTQPFRSFFFSAADKIGKTADSFMHASAYAEENEMLRARIAKMEQEEADAASYKAENERLSALLGMKAEMAEINLQGARVIGRESDNWYNTVSIDKGTSSGVKVNDIVMTSMGLVGTVKEVGLTWAKVREITDVESSIGAVCPRTGDRGIIEGDYALAASGKLRLNYLSKDATVVIGDRIEISGAGSIYPKGVYIGKIVEIADNDNGLTLSAVIQSEVNFGALNEVLVGR